MNPWRSFSACVSRVAIAAVLTIAAIPSAHAVPSFARQTGMGCQACHTVWPELTHFGRMFKASGYVIDNLKQIRGVTPERDEMLSLAALPPLSIMVQASYTQLSRPLPDGTVVADSQNGSVGFPQQIGIFYAGKIAPHLGAFLQLTYSSAGGGIAIDNTDIRFANLAILPGDQSLVYGVSLNNNPTVQDIWNSTPAFGFPYASTAVGIPLGPPKAQIDGVRAQDVAGLTAYAFWNETLYGEVGMYRSAKQGASVPLNSGTPNGVIDGVAPYWRVAYEHNWGRNSIEGGLYGLAVNIFPDAGNPTSPGYGQALAGPTDRYRDVAADVQYQFLADQHNFSVVGTWIHEARTLNASFAYSPALAGNLRDDLTTFRGFATYYYKRKFGGTAGYFSTTGSTDSILTPNGPDTNGWIAEFNYLPWLNIKLSLQYTAYTKFGGLSVNYDGAGRNAKDNDTLYALAWLSY